MLSCTFKVLFKLFNTCSTFLLLNLKISELTFVFFSPSCLYSLPPVPSFPLIFPFLPFLPFTSSLRIVEVSVSGRRRGIARCPKTPPSYPSYLPTSSNGNRRGAEGWRDPGEGGEGGRNMAERRRGSWHHGERKASAVAGKGRIPGSPLWPARRRAGPGGGAAAVADTARPRIRHSLAHHTCSGNRLQMATCCGVHVVCASVRQQRRRRLWKRTRAWLGARQVCGQR